MYATHWATSATHQFDVADGAKLLTSAYYTYFNRDWWRQSSNSNQRPNDASDPACGGLANLDTTCGNEGRLRQYWTAGIEPRLSLEHTLFGVDNVLDTGLRYHQEHQYRVQANGDTPDARQPGTGRNAGKGRQRSRGDRLVRIRAEPLRPGPMDGHARPALRARGLPARRQPARQSRHGERGRMDPRHRRDVRGGARHDGVRRHTSRLLAAGGRGHHHAHRRHGKPRPRVLLELRARHPQRRTSGLYAEATLFRLDFENQIVPASVAGGTGAGLTSAGQTLQDGLEVAGNIESNGFVDWPVDVFGRLSWAWLWTAEYVGDRFSTVPGSTNVKVTGNRLPYTPEQLLAGTIGMRSRIGLTVELEGVYRAPLIPTT